MDSLKDGVKKGTWSSLEDELLTHYVQIHGERKWRSLAQKAGLNRSGKSCRLRWLNYLRPGIKRGDFSADEDELIIKLHRLLGNRWALIAGRLPGRTDNEVKNYWNTILVKKLQGQKSHSGSSTRQFQAEDMKAFQVFSRRKVQEIPGQAIEANNVLVRGNVDDGQSSSPSLMQIYQDDNSVISSMDAFNRINFFISDGMEFDSFQGKCDDKVSVQLENGDQTDPLQHMELKKIASLLDIENELRELL